MNQVNIIMYHYVRPIKESPYPKIKGLELGSFQRQLDYLSQNYTFITAEDVIDSSATGKPLPDNSCWLTFDDGYKDHYSYVLPELVKRNIQGSFFPPVKPIIERTMLDVNSIHFILASASSIDILVEDLNSECRNLGYSQKELGTLWREHATPSRYDTKEVIYVKRLLQHALPETSRNEVTSTLFRKYVGVSQDEFSEKLYMSSDEIRELVNCGMYVGSHGYRHLWLNKEDKLSQRMEIEKSLEFLSYVGASTTDWIMCYPYGAHNQDTLDILSASKCAFGITTEVCKADLNMHHPLKLPRFDTNDFPQ